MAVLKTMNNSKFGDLEEIFLKNTINKEISASVEPEDDKFIVTINKSYRKYLVYPDGTVNKITWWRKQENNEKYVTNGEVTIKVGDYIDYDANSNEEISYTAISDKTGVADDQVFSTSFDTGGWRLLDVYYEKDGDHLALVSNSLIKSTENIGLRLYGAKGYAYGVDEIKNISAIYGKGKNASYSRAFEIDDINKITGYNPLETRDGLKYGEGTVDEFMNKVTVTNQGKWGPYLVVNNNGQETTSTYWYFTYWDESKNDFDSLSSYTNKQFEFVNNAFWYYVSEVGLSTSSIEYKLLFGNYKNFWIATKFGSFRYYGIYCTENTRLGPGSTGNHLKQMTGGTFTNTKAIQPMICLEASIDLEKDGKKNNFDFWRIK